MSIDTLTSIDEKAPPFGHTISEAFEPYLSVWVEAQDKWVGPLIAIFCHLLTIVGN